ncbi:MAG TPA: 50S ribosomal protein L24 [candidate division Zixibacteria bacterium]|nr:50S ribosomal protein L24 [candidate division Zixibacteria bacterium]
MPPIRVKKNDIVKVIAGNSRGKKGKVLKVYPRSRRVVVEGVNFILRHTRPSSQTQQGGIQEREAPVNVSNVMLICPKCGGTTRIGMHFTDDGSKVRFCKKCREMIDA